MVEYTVVFHMSLAELDELKKHIACENVTPEIYFKRAVWGYSKGKFFNDGNTRQGRF